MLTIVHSFTFLGISPAPLLSSDTTNMRANATNVGVLVQLIEIEPPDHFVFNNQFASDEQNTILYQTRLAFSINHVCHCVTPPAHPR